MSEPGMRPGGLTALAIINFIFGGFGVLGSFGTMAAPMLMQVAEREEERAAAEARAAETRADAERESPQTAPATRPGRDAAETRAHAAFQKTAKENPQVFFLDGGVNLILSLALVIAGIGYLKLRRFLGKTVGTLYGLGAIAWGGVEIAYVHEVMDTGFGLLNLVGFLYPVVTLVCLHMVFRDDFVN